MARVVLAQIVMKGTTVHPQEAPLPNSMLVRMVKLALPALRLPLTVCRVTQVNMALAVHRAAQIVVLALIRVSMGMLALALPALPVNTSTKEEVTMSRTAVVAITSIPMPLPAAPLPMTVPIVLAAMVLTFSTTSLTAN